jgi:hypothetical protein
MKSKDSEVVARRQAELAARLDPSWQPEMAAPLLFGGGLCYEISDRVTAIKYGGIAVIVHLIRHLDLPAAIDQALHLLKRHRPYHESDHVLNMALNIMVGGYRIEDLELRRHDVGYMDVLGGKRIPDPTTERDFLRRFDAWAVERLMDGINKVRQRLWLTRPPASRQLALIDVDGTMAETTGKCKQDADFSYKGTWGYGPLVLSLANTQEVLYVVNRSANEPSHAGAVKWIDKAVSCTKAAGFRQVRVRGDTDFSLTQHFDGWSEDDVQFVFGMDANQHFVRWAKELSEDKWALLKRRAGRPLTSPPRLRPLNVKEKKIRERGYTNYRLVEEHIAEIDYKPKKAKRRYRLVILRKRINVEKGQQQLEDEIKYFFYVTNVSVRDLKANEVVFESNARCHQENLIKQLKNGVRATQMPAGDLVSNWAYMVIASLAWNLKVWLGLTLPEETGSRALVKMEFRRFVKEVMSVSAQILRQGRRTVIRLQELSGRWAKLLLEADAWFRRRHRYA